MKKLLLLFLSIGMLPLLSNAACTLTTTGNQTICAGSTANLNGTGTGGFTAYNWTSTGTGTFSNFTTLNTIYTPSNADITAGTVTIIITGTGGTCTTTTSSLILTIAPLPTSNAGTDLTRCVGMGAVNLNGTMSAGANFMWTTSGSGSFSNMTMPTSTYIPSTADENAGTVTLTAKVTNSSGCIVSDNLVITSVPMPTSNAGPDLTRCAGMGAVNLNGTMSAGANFMWTTSGSGSFSNMTMPTSTYIPSTADENAGTVTLTAKVTNASGCIVSDNLVITSVPMPTSNAGPDLTRCAGMGAVNLNGTMSAGANFMWTTSGSGSFSNMTMPTTTYIPSTADETAGTVTLTAKVTNASGCIVSDNLVITILANPIVNAGFDQTTCIGTETTVSNATAIGATSLHWTTSGTGVFSNNTILKPTYQPSPADETTGSVTLTLTATKLACTSSDQLTYTIQKNKQTVNAGPDQFITSGSATFIGNATGTNAYQWSSKGTGSFSNPTNLTTSYTPSASDITNGIVKLTLKSTSADVCDYAEDQVLLTIGTDLTVSGLIKAGSNSLDKGVALLFKQDNTGLHYLKSDTIGKTLAGVFSFNHLPAGNYVVLASPISGSSYLNSHIPTYTTNAETWKTATSFELINNTSVNIDLNLYTSADATWNTGTDVISGIIFAPENSAANARTTVATIPAPYVLVYLMNVSGNKIAYTQTDKYGRYTFKNVKAGTYKIAPEYVNTDLAGNASSIAVESDGSSSTTEDGSMTLEERTSSTTSILNKTSSTSVYAYPNPTKDIVAINVSNTSGSGELKLYNETGSITFQKVVSLNEPTLTVNIEALPKGIYMLQLVTYNTVYTSKVIKQ